MEKEIGFCLDSEKEKAEYLNIKEISFLSEILDWTSQIYLPAIENPNFFNKSIQGKCQISLQAMKLLEDTAQESPSDIIT